MTLLTDGRAPVAPATAARWRTGAFALALAWTLWGASAAAQTVKVRNAAPGATLEVVYGAEVVATTAADGRGAADIVIPPAGAERPEIDAFVLVDECGARRRIVITPQGATPAPPDGACFRREIQGLFLVKPVSTLVIDLGATQPTLRLRQRPFDPDSPPRTWTAAPTGLVLSGGGGLTFLGDTTLLACGTVAGCEADDTGFGYGGTVSYWFTPYFGGEFGAIRVADGTAEGSDATYRFTSTIESRALLFGGRFGVPVGPVRFFGRGGGAYHRTNWLTSQTIDEKTITVDGVTEVIPGGTQDLALETAGWGWYVGGGMEFWFNRWFSVYGDFGRVTLKGDPVDDVEGQIDDRAFYLFVGASVRIGR
ncbi:MAG: porin family protein [Vicinamibacterales bacterium]|nr:porin family protein [Vicinamibacterales bacterium]